jgi:hypothetical protein
MNRRDFLKLTSSIAGVLATVEALADEPRRKTMNKGKNATLAPACGLYCGACIAYDNGACHGCGCECGQCVGKRARSCDIAKCAKSEGFDTCASCKDLPCTRVIQFTCDPVWRTHTPCIENLRRQRQIGIEVWLQEQKSYWSNERMRQRWLALHKECHDRARTFAK